jgi:hypothetical protein
MSAFAVGPRPDTFFRLWVRSLRGWRPVASLARKLRARGFQHCSRAWVCRALSELSREGVNVYLPMLTCRKPELKPSVN